MGYSAVGIIFSSLNDNTFSRLTANRTVAAIPFACRYRLIDFALSNMVNANISNINIVTNYNYRSLLEHIGSGKDFDLARRSGGITFISPFQSSHKNDVKIFNSRMEALKSMYEYIEEFKEEYVVLSDSDTVLNINFQDVINYHVASEASVTFVTKTIGADFSSKTPRMMLSSSFGNISDISLNSAFNIKYPELSLNIYVMKTEKLKKIVNYAIYHSENSLTSFFLSAYKKEKFKAYNYNGYVASVAGFSDYYRSSMELLSNQYARESLFGKKNAPIFTKVHNSAPTRHASGAVVKNSMIADECVIHGEVENSILFRGVHVGSGSVVKNSILFHGTYIEDGVNLDYILTDKDVRVSCGVTLSGNINMPFYVQKGKKV